MIANNLTDIDDGENMRLNSADAFGLTLWQATGHCCPFYLISHLINNTFMNPLL